MRSPPAAEVARWFARLLARVDAKDTAGFVGFFHPEATFRFANQPPSRGRYDIGVAVEGFFGGVRALRHDILHAWSVPGHAICEGRVTYMRHDGAQVTLPFVNVLELRDGLVSDYRVYVDAAPLFAAC